MKKDTRKDRKKANKKQKAGQNKAKRHAKHDKSSKRTDRNSRVQQDMRHETPSLYGFHAVREAWLNPHRYIKALYMTANAAQDFEAVINEGKDKGLNRPTPVAIEKKKLDNILQPGAVHQGLGLVTSPLDKFDLQDLINHSQGRERSVLIILDQVTDPHNVGAIIRSACVFGAHGLIMQSKHAPSLDGVLAKTACGGVEHLPVVYETNLNRTIEALQESGFFVYGLDERGDTICDISPAQNSALVLGAEGPGLRRLVKENCDSLVKLPTKGEISSLNVSNASAVALYAFTSE